MLVCFITACPSYSQEQANVFDLARNGSVEQVKEMLRTNPNGFNVVNNNGFTPLILACYNGNNEVAKVLIASGSDINTKTKMGTPLMAAVVRGNNEIAQLLIDKKADVNAADESGITALIYAVQFQNMAILKLLLQNNADKTHKDNEGKTAFEHAILSRNEEIINLLK
jgi:ankyrin repeat protein